MVSIYFECLDAKKLNQSLNEIKAMFPRVESIHLEESKVNNVGSIGVKILVEAERHDKIGEIIDKINALENVNFALVLDM